MTQVQVVERVSALRKRLEEIAPSHPQPLSELYPQLKQLQELSRQAQVLQTQLGKVQDRLDTLAPNVSSLVHTGHHLAGPRQLSWQTRRLLLECRECLQTLRNMGEDLSEEVLDNQRWLAAYQLTVHMTECLLRGLQALPESALDQNRLAQGLAGWLNWLRAQVNALVSLRERHKRLAEHIYALSHAIANLSQGRPVLQRPLLAMAEELLQSDLANQPLELLTPVLPQERWAAIHGWNTAQVVARIVNRHPECRTRALFVVVAALLHDCGMASLSASIFEQASPLSDDQRREVEAHVGVSAEAMRLLWPDETWLVEGVRAHHERLDGSGYPFGAQGKAINSLARLLAVADTYAALCTRRAYRPAYSPRQALMEVLAESEQGRLDVTAAELLLELSLYPIGSIVELSDGSIGQVIALNQVASDQRLATPIVAVLLDGEGKPLGMPRYVNLASKSGPHLVRNIPVEELLEMQPGGFWVQILPVAG
jgi:HD-GYP domain-containing protein (c-di-GMP phosphodiesterase class II)